MRLSIYQTTNIYICLCIYYVKHGKCFKIIEKNDDEKNMWYVQIKEIEPINKAEEKLLNIEDIFFHIYERKYLLYSAAFLPLYWWVKCFPSNSK